MEYRFNEIEKKWQDQWKADKVYKVSNDSTKPKYYVLDMFPYPSGAGLHVGHPLGYIASDIYSRYKRLKGFNVLHPMGFDSFGLPAEQYAIETGQHPAATTKNNIATFKGQLDKIGFCYDWDREVRTSDPQFYKWTQWIFLQLFNSYFCNTQKKALPIAGLINKYANMGAMPKNGKPVPGVHFTADEWNGYSKNQQEDILMKRRLAFCAYGEVNWCEALGTVLANDEVVNGVSERGGHPVEKKKMRQWYLRITAYADRLLDGLEKVDFSDSMKEMQRNWIGKSMGAEIEFSLTPAPSPYGEGGKGEGSKQETPLSGHFFKTADQRNWPILKDLSRENRKNKTEAEAILWQVVRNNKLGYKVRRQHVIDGFIIDFAFLNQKVLVEVDGGYQEEEDQKKYDEAKTAFLIASGYTVARFTNEEVLNNTNKVAAIIINLLDNNQKPEVKTPLSGRRGAGGEAMKLKVYTTRPDTIFGVDFMVAAPELDLVQQIKSTEQATAVDEYIAYVKIRSDVDRMAEKKITGCFTGSYAINPFSGQEIPIYISEYVLAVYGTGAIMAVPCGDERDFKFAQHFNIPITNIIGNYFNGEEANATKEAVLENSGFLNGMKMMDASEVVLQKLEEQGIGKRKVNYRMRDAGFSRQRYWGEPFPIIWSDGVAIPLDADELPLELPHVDKYGPGPDGEGPLANITEWVNISSGTLPDLTPSPSPKERGAGDHAVVDSAASLVSGSSKDSPGYFNSTEQEWRNTLHFAKDNRKDLTEAENIIWEEVRNRKIGGFKFRRQHPLAGYIPDFVCLDKNLIIEIDGEYHNEEDQKRFDEARQNWLQENRFELIRFTNAEVKTNLKEVLKKISQKLQQDKSKSLTVTAIQQEEKSQASAESGFPLFWRGAGGEVRRETSTMPGYAGSSWYFLRYMDPHNTEAFCDRKASDYWNQVDLYIGGTEHAVGHLLYSRLWTKVLFDLGYIGYEEPFKKLLNQGMITGKSFFADYIFAVSLKDNNNKHVFTSSCNTARDSEKIDLDGEVFGIVNIETRGNRIKYGHKYVDSKNRLTEKQYTNLIRNEIKLGEKVRNAMLKYVIWEKDLTENGERYFNCFQEGEKMSKSKFNVDNPDEIVEQYGADTFRMYEMFLGPVEASKPWDTKGIEGVHRFLRKLWRLFFDDIKGKVWTSSTPSPMERAGGEATDAELKVLHKTIKKIEEDTERFSFNTAVSTFMICVNELSDLKCHKKEILKPLLILLTPYAPHIAEELWHSLGSQGSVLDASYPTFNPALLVESSKEYPISINGKVRANMNMSLDIDQNEVEKLVLANESVQKWLEGKDPKKIIYVKNKMVNVVI